MAREVIWTRSRYELICDQGMLNDADRKTLEMHIMGSSNLEIAVTQHCDISKINEDINRFKQIYDALQREFPDKLETRDKDIYRKKRKKIHNN